MTKYHGGKQRIGKAIAKAIAADLAETPEIVYESYNEPFCGMMSVYVNLIDSIRPFLKTGSLNGMSDINRATILMWKGLASGDYVPAPQCPTEEEYYALRDQEELTAESGFVLHKCTFRGIYADAWYPVVPSSWTSSVKRVLARVEAVKAETTWSSGDYESMSDLESSIIYCDPPYSGTVCVFSNGDKKKLKFDHDRFWTWTSKMIEKGNVVYVSEFSIKPEVEHRIIWSRGLEKLYRLI